MLSDLAFAFVFLNPIASSVAYVAVFYQKVSVCVVRQWQHVRLIIDVSLQSNHMTHTSQYHDDVNEIAPKGFVQFGTGSKHIKDSKERYLLGQNTTCKFSG